MTQRIVIYARYSSDLQSPASIEDQIRICRARADKGGWKTHRGLAGRILQGRAIGQPPYGYAIVRRLDGNGEPEHGLRDIDPAQSVIVERIFREYAAGRSPKSIAKALNAGGVAGPGGGIWFDETIRGRPYQGTRCGRGGGPARAGVAHHLPGNLGSGPGADWTGTGGDGHQ